MTPLSTPAAPAVLSRNIPGALGASDDDAELKAVYRRIRWRLLPLLGLCYLVAYLDRINVGFAKLSMLGSLGFTESQFGWAAGLFFVGYVLFEMPSNWLLIRVGTRLWITRIMVSWGLLSALCGFVQSAHQFYALRFLLGLAEAGFLPGVLYYLSRWFPSHQRGRVFSLFLIGLPLAGILGGPMSGGIMHGLDGALSLHGWQWLFLVEGVPSIALGIAFWAMMPDSPAKAAWLSAREKLVLECALAADAAPAAHQGFLAGVIDWKVWVLGGIDFAILLTTYALSFWLPSFIRNTGLTDPVLIGLCVAVPNLAGLIGMLVISRSSDRHRERRWHIMAPFAVGALALAFFPMVAHNLLGILLLLSIVSATVTGVVPVYFSLPATFLSGEAAAAGFAMATSLASIAGLVSNTVMGFAASATGSPAGALWIFAAMLVVGIGLVAVLPASQVNR